MKTPLKLIVLLTFLVFNSCKKEIGFDYKYSDQPDISTCEHKNRALIKEAVYSMEADITAQFTTSEPNLSRAYSTFLASARNKRLPYLEMVSPHTIKVFEALKKEGAIFNGGKLNYKSPVIDCVSKNIKDAGFKTTFNALLQTNSLREDIIITPLMGIARNMVVDKYLATYTALEFYYEGMYDIDLTKVTGKPQPQVDFNKVPKQTPVEPTPTQKKDSHAGHNHD